MEPESACSTSAGSTLAGRAAKPNPKPKLTAAEVDVARSAHREAIEKIKDPEKLRQFKDEVVRSAKLIKAARLPDT